MGGEAIACSSSTSIKTSGQSARLLSLAREHWAFTGGAHGNGATTGILWDRGLNKEISFDSLFLSPAGLTQLRAPYCRALDAERKKRRGPDYEKGTITEFDTCPKFSDLALIAADSVMMAGSTRFNSSRRLISLAPTRKGSMTLPSPSPAN